MTDRILAPKVATEEMRKAMRDKADATMGPGVSVLEGRGLMYEAALAAMPANAPPSSDRTVEKLKRAIESAKNGGAEYLDLTDDRCAVIDGHFDLLKIVAALTTPDQDNVETNLANAARRALADFRTFRSDEHRAALQKALDAYDQQQVDFIDFRSRVSHSKILEIYAEELDEEGLAARANELRTGEPASKTLIAGIAAMQRIAAYADHLRQIVLAIGTNPSLSIGDLVYKIREATGGDWDHPDVIAWSKVCAAVKGEVDAKP